jgi:C-terminal processing protease CtpA/Prc
MCRKRTHPFILYFLVILLPFFISGCSGRMHGYSPLKKYAPEELKEDYDFLRNVLEKFHPSLYWYTPKDSMDFYFDAYRMALSDSMTEQQFGFKVIAPLTTNVRCGHTSFSFSKEYTRFFRGVPLPSFPLFMKIWCDTMIVTNNLQRNDSILRRGTQITSINGIKTTKLTNTMFRFMPTDGYSENINYIRLSNAFPYYHRNIFGLSKSYQVSYIDSLEQEKTTRVSIYNPQTDTSRKQITADKKKKTAQKTDRRKKRDEYRSLEIDTENKTAVMYLSSFDNGYRLKKFYRKSFKEIHKENIKNLVVDIRNNGGGKVDNYTTLARYIKDTSFKVADTAFSLRKNFGKYSSHFKNSFINWTAFQIFTSKKPDQHYHFRYWENHVFHPFKKNHFDGRVYVLIGGPTFSASSLFCNTVKGQENVLLVGEETGGGAYGNSGLMIPHVTLPNTGLRVRIPLFRMVQYNHTPKSGHGVTPDIYVPPAAYAVRKSIDLKMEKVKELIRISPVVAKAGPL